LQYVATKGNTDEHNGKGDKELTFLLLAISLRSEFENEVLSKGFNH
jgi:hypothetical protein